MGTHLIANIFPSWTHVSKLRPLPGIKFRGGNGNFNRQELGHCGHVLGLNLPVILFAS